MGTTAKSLFPPVGILSVISHTHTPTMLLERAHGLAGKMNEIVGFESRSSSLENLSSGLTPTGE